MRDYSQMYETQRRKRRKEGFTCILGQDFIFSSCGMVLVTTTASKGALLMREMAGPENIPCVRMA